jgi:hypothetical protein
MTRRRYGPKVYVRTPGCGCVGCSAPVLLVIGALAWALVVAVIWAMAGPG